jgi:hypothetical protein
MRVLQKRANQSPHSLPQLIGFSRSREHPMPRSYQPNLR